MWKIDFREAIRVVFAKKTMRNETDFRLSVSSFDSLSCWISVYLIAEAFMSYETVIEQVKSLPESSLEDVSRYIEFLLYQQEQADMAPLIESDEVFEEKMERGYADAIEGRGKPLEDVFSDLSKRFA